MSTYFIDMPYSVCYNITHNNMDKTLKPIEQQPTIADTTPEVRGEILAELPRIAKLKAVEVLVESAMVNGITDPYQVMEWLGEKISGIGTKTIAYLIPQIKARWLEDADDVLKHAKEQRAIQVQKAWHEVKECEKMYYEAETLKDRAMVKKLQLEWMQYISKLTFVDRLVESAQRDMEINVFGNMEMGKSTLGEVQNGD